LNLQPAWQLGPETEPRCWPPASWVREEKQHLSKGFDLGFPESSRKIKQKTRRVSDTFLGEDRASYSRTGVRERYSGLGGRRPQKAV